MEPIRLKAKGTIHKYYTPVDVVVSQGGED